MPKISLMIHTASRDNFLSNKGIPSYFEAITSNLIHQTFKDFEFIYIDTYYEENKFNLNFPFKVKHVPIHPNHRYWYDKGHVYIAAAKNTGLIHADGELVVTCDDAEFLPDHLLELYWNYYKNGYLMQALHKRLKNITNLYPIEGDVYINDSRFTEVINYKSRGAKSFAGCCFPLKSALFLNGYNEKFDGQKSLDDCDFGNRLEFIGEKFVLDPNGYIYILDHKSYGGKDINTGWLDVKQEQVIEHEENPKITNFIAIENYGLMCCTDELFDVIANKSPITEQHLKIIQRETLKHRFFDPLAQENKEKLKIWLNTPNFNLIKEKNGI